MNYFSLTHLMSDEFLLRFARKYNWAYAELFSRGLVDEIFGADDGEAPEGAKW